MRDELALLSKQRDRELAQRCSDASSAACVALTRSAIAMGNKVYLTNGLVYANSTEVPALNTRVLVAPGTASQELYGVAPNALSNIDAIRNSAAATETFLVGYAAGLDHNTVSAATQAVSALSDSASLLVLTCRVSSDQSQFDFLVSVDKSFFKPAMNSAGVR